MGSIITPNAWDVPVLIIPDAWAIAVANDHYGGDGKRAPRHSVYS